MLIPGLACALEPVPDLQNQRLFMSAEQRNEIDRDDSESPLSLVHPADEADSESGSQNTPVIKKVVEAKRRSRQTRLDGVVVRSDGRVFAWLNKRAVAATQRTGLNTDDSKHKLVFSVSDHGEGLVLSPGQSVLVDESE